jgi:hypothetical protein
LLEAPATQHRLESAFKRRIRQNRCRIHPQIQIRHLLPLESKMELGNNNNLAAENAI